MFVRVCVKCAFICVCLCVCAGRGGEEGEGERVKVAGSDVTGSLSLQGHHSCLVSQCVLTASWCHAHCPLAALPGATVAVAIAHGKSGAPELIKSLSLNYAKS